MKFTEQNILRGIENLVKERDELNAAKVKYVNLNSQKKENFSINYVENIEKQIAEINAEIKLETLMLNLKK